MAEGMTRRNTLTGAAAVGLAAPLLAACGSGGSDGGTSEPAPRAGEKLGPSSAVPVGGGKVYAEPKVVVTQPAAGTFEGFSAICTHQGCLVSNVEGGTINCTCHGSKFSVKDGSVTTGPATSPLPRVRVKVDGGELETA